ncbi:MAG: segregation/condensation protein A [Kofleriaceae bacterium]|nr:segregation/condensation protein A [Kofleriaceae bacterium]MBP9170306.1 segregation/condensation protein A [Kofleriaceae bacterium]MBP9860039.1 segregation/condensation protein A [Kofleriaceae bacterium]
MANYQIAIDVFEGPLDLLLHLVRKHELEILDIPIAFITQKYLEYLDAMQRLDIDVAGEYLVMAATLCHLKSRELLPNPEPEPVEETDEDAPLEEIDTRAELIKRLLEYQKFKEAANRLGDRPVVGRNVWGRGSSLEDAVADGIDPGAVAPLAPFPVHKLIEALDRLMRAAKIKVTHNVLIDRLSVSQRISELTDRLEREGEFTFTSMFRFARPDVEMTYAEIKHEAVVTLLAVLEMAKLRLIAIRQDEGDLEIFIARVATDLREAVARTVAGSDEYR